MFFKIIQAIVQAQSALLKGSLIQGKQFFKIQGFRDDDQAPGDNFPYNVMFR